MSDIRHRTPSTAAFAASLHAAKTAGDMVALCRARTAASDVVIYNSDDLDLLVPAVADHAEKGLESWAFYLRRSDSTLPDAIYDFALNSALNGGYFAAQSDGTVRQWEKRGSGSAALLAWLTALSAREMLPGVHLHTPEAARAALTPLVAGLPMAEQRLAICTEFARPDIIAVLTEMVASIRDSSTLVTYFTWRFTGELAAAFPASFGGDPFRKKAALFCLELAGHLAARGEHVIWQLCLPTDYQIPRIFQWHHILHFSADATLALRAGTLRDVESTLVTDIRAAAIVAAADLATMAHTTSAIVDNALFMTYRMNPYFIAEALPPMRCASMWF